MPTLIQVLKNSLSTAVECQTLPLPQTSRRIQTNCTSHSSQGIQTDAPTGRSFVCQTELYRLHDHYSQTEVIVNLILKSIQCICNPFLALMFNIYYLIDFYSCIAITPNININKLTYVCIT